MCQAMRIICNGTITELKKTGANCDMDCGCNPVFGPKVGPMGNIYGITGGGIKQFGDMVVTVLLPLRMK